MRQACEDVKALIDLADAATYQAKRCGPGGIASHGDVAAGGYRASQRLGAARGEAALPPAG